MGVNALASALHVPRPEASALKKAWLDGGHMAPAAHGGQRDAAGSPLDLLKGAKPLSKSEADDYKDILQAALSDCFEPLDDYLHNRQRQAGMTTTPAPIWSDLDELEIESLTKAILRGGQKNKYLGTAVRAAVELDDYRATAIIVIPRVKKTHTILKETRAAHRAAIRAARGQRGKGPSKDAN